MDFEFLKDRRIVIGLGGALATVARVLLGSAAGFYYFVLPVYMWLKNLVWPKGWEM